MALRLLRRLLSGGGSSRLHLKLREQMGVVYSVDATISAYADTGSFSLDFSTAPENLDAAVAATFTELRRIVTEPVDGGELERVRRSCLYELEYGADSCYDMQIRYGWGEIVGLVCHPEEERREMLAIDVGAIGALARELFGPDHLNLVAVGPVTAELGRKLEELLGEYERWFREEIPLAELT
jgi:predicted Zn-dependent peptidase